MRGCEMGSGGTMRVLVLGGSGQVGRELQGACWPEALLPVFPSRAEADLTDAAALARLIAAEPWGVVINAAAYTHVDGAETDHSAAFAVNGEGPATLARLTAARGLPLIHLSTDYVFDGRSDRPYREDDPVNPINVYGASKAAGEDGVRRHTATHLILRTAWVYSRHRRNFLTTMVALAVERDEVRVVDDQRGTPTSAAELAAALVHLAALLTHRARRQADRPAVGPGSAPLASGFPWGTYHLTSRGSTSWFGFATAIFAALHRHGRRVPRCVAIPSSAYPSPVRRPAYSVLACARFDATFGWPRPHWRTQVAAAVDRLVGPAAAGDEAGESGAPACR